MENDENDSSVDELISQFESQNVIHGKHFVSGTPRKKILAEIYQFPSAQNHGNLNPSKKGVSDSDVWCYGHASEPKDDSSMKVYDPLTNYLSPRPTYLRFNPNWRSEVLKRLENEGREELNMNSPDSVQDEEESPAKEVEDSSLSSPKVRVVDQRNEEISDEVNDNVIDGYEVEEEEEIEDRGWCVRRVLEILLTLIACLLSTSYICSMNSSTNSPSQQAVWNLRDGGGVIKNGSLEFVSTKMSIDGFFQGEDGGNYRLIEEVEVDDHESFKEAETVESFEQFENFKTDESLEIEEEEEDDDDKESYGEIDENFEAELVQDLERFEREVIRNENDSKETVDESAKFEFKADGNEQIVDAKTDENPSDGVESVLDVHEASKTEIMDDGGVNSNPQRWEQSIDEKTVEREDEAGSIELDGELSDSMDEVEDDDDEEEEEVEEEKPEWNTTTVAGISAVVIVLTSLAIIYNSKKPRRNSSPKDFEPVLEQNIAVEDNELLPSMERKVEFLSRAPMREAPRELACNVHAPTVELIGEIFVGKPRGSGKYKMSISEDECNVATLHQIHASLPPPQPVSTPSSQPPAIELHPTISNSSYGSFTTERKMTRKEGGQSRESTIETTPVRRSSRLRSRSTVKSQ